jgi:hypothetical protein
MQTSGRKACSLPHASGPLQNQRGRPIWTNFEEIQTTGTKAGSSDLHHYFPLTEQSIDMVRMSMQEPTELSRHTTRYQSQHWRLFNRDNNSIG